MNGTTFLADKDVLDLVLLEKRIIDRQHGTADAAVVADEEHPWLPGGGLAS